GLMVHWGMSSKSFDMPWFLHTLAYEQQMADGSWISVFDPDAKPYAEAYPFTYTLKSGKIQNRIATVSKRRHVLCRRMFKMFGWPRWIKESIDIDFDGEVGERSGSWKGGTMGCSYNLRRGETMEQALRRMGRDRKFR
ncbi:MAG: hypothetical protein ACKVKF_25850, partial [Rhodobacterales bacterium]